MLDELLVAGAVARGKVGLAARKTVTRRNIRNVKMLLICTGGGFAALRAAVGEDGLTFRGTRLTGNERRRVVQVDPRRQRLRQGKA